MQLRPNDFTSTDLGDTPSDYNQSNPQARWIPRGDAPAPSHFSVETRFEAEDELNEHFAKFGFAVYIDRAHYHRLAVKDAGKHVTSCTIWCAHGRRYKLSNKGQRRKTISAMTGCEWKGRLHRDDSGCSFEVEIPHYNHRR
jgi:hypothetical protein